MKKLLALSLFVASVAWAVPIGDAVSKKIKNLLARLQASACEFNRNGRWYSAHDAQDQVFGPLLMHMSLQLD